MLLSIFTPTHNPTFLRELYESILEQEGNVPFEWIIVPNGKCTQDDIPQEFTFDTRIKILPSTATGVGALKKFACSRCVGDVLVEVDHDDLLAPNCFQELAGAHKTTPGGFYYSDFINVRSDTSCEVYGAQYGWESYYARIDGRQYIVNRSFEPSARSVCQIYFAPNHIRAWDRKLYELVGGHDERLSVGDDHDIVCRTYLTGAPFVWIQKPLYIYRRWPEQTFPKNAALIRKQQQRNCNKYLHKLIAVECKHKGLTMVNMGSLDNCPENYIQYDQLPQPVSKDSIGCIRAFEYLNTINRGHAPALMDNFYRVLIPGGWLLTRTPSYNDTRGGINCNVKKKMLHHNWWGVKDFEYFTTTKKARTLKTFNGRFQMVRMNLYYQDEEHRKREHLHLAADLCALKSQRQPGLCEI